MAGVCLSNMFQNLILFQTVLETQECCILFGICEWLQVQEPILFIFILLYTIYMVLVYKCQLLKRNVYISSLWLQPDKQKMRLL